MTGCFPRFTKLAWVSQIFKATDSTDIINHKPIYVLPFLSKTLDKIVFNQFHRFSDYFNINNYYQFGFCKYMTISDAVNDCLKYIYDSIDDGQIIVSIFLDYTKTFDCGEHSLLSRKLYAYVVCINT